MITRKDLYMHTLTVVMNFYEYGSYSRDETRAVKALNKKFPAISPRRCAGSFKRTLRMYSAAVRFVENNAQYYLHQYRNKKAPRYRSPQELGFINAYRGIPRSVTMAAINWIFYWHHLR